MFSCLFLLACNRTEIESTDNITEENLLEYRIACPEPSIELAIVDNPLPVACPGIEFRYLGTNDPETECTLVSVGINVWRSLFWDFGPFTQKSFDDPEFVDNAFSRSYAQVSNGDINSEHFGLSFFDYRYFGTGVNAQDKFSFNIINNPSTSGRVWVCVRATYLCNGVPCTSDQCTERLFLCW